jgi:glycosyltransferase involved in cell wall biosynthesis
MAKIKVVHHCNQLGLGGTEKTMQLLCARLDPERFEAHVLAPRFPVPPHRVWLNAAKALLGSRSARAKREQYSQIHSRAGEISKTLGPGRVHFYTPGSLAQTLRGLSPQILHLHHSGGSEPPLNRPDALAGIPVLFSTNVFGERPDAPDLARLDRILFVSNWLKEQAAWASGDARCGVLPCPIETPAAEGDLRDELKISDQDFVVGRSGRNADDIYDGIALRAYKTIESQRTVLLALSPPPAMRRQARELGIRRVIWLEPTVDPVFLSRFYNTLDVLAHARLDGETFGMVIAEALMHGKPVVTHRSNHRNAQCELVDESCGFIAERNGDAQYAASLKTLLENPGLRRKMGEAARKSAMDRYEAGAVARRLEELYREALKAKGVSLF